MKKQVNLLHPETDELIASVNLLTIDWYDILQSTFEDYLNDGGETIDGFIEYVKENTDLKIEKI